MNRIIFRYFRISIIFFLLPTGEKRKPSSESFSLENREGSGKRQSKHSRHQNEARHAMMINSEGSKFINSSMNTENCTCNMYGPRLSNTSQELLKPVKRDACTSPTIPSTNNLTYATRKGISDKSWYTCSSSIFWNIINKFDQ